jgi:hypothetical protein
MTMIAILVLMFGGLTRVAVLSWRRPERLDSMWVWKWPGDVAPTGPMALRPMQDWTDVRRELGATMRSPSPLEELAAVEMLPLDDADEWLSVRLSAFDHAIMAIGAATRGMDGSVRPVGWTVDEELAAFQLGSMGLHEYRSMVLDSTGSYGPREAMQLEEMLADA